MVSAFCSCLSWLKLNPQVTSCIHTLILDGTLTLSFLGAQRGRLVHGEQVLPGLQEGLRLGERFNGRTVDIWLLQ